MEREVGEEKKIDEKNGEGRREKRRGGREKETRMLGGYTLQSNVLQMRNS